MLAIGLLGGFMQVNVFTWIQRACRADDGPRDEHLHVHLHGTGAAVGRAGRLVADQGSRYRNCSSGGGIILVVFAALAYLLTPIREIRSMPLQSQ
jgi:hypothetical protein